MEKRYSKVREFILHVKFEFRTSTASRTKPYLDFLKSVEVLTGFLGISNSARANVFMENLHTGKIEVYFSHQDELFKAMNRLEKFIINDHKEEKDIFAPVVPARIFLEYSGTSRIA